MENKPSPVESVDRALMLLLSMRERGTLSVKVAAEILGVAPSTAHRLLNALAFRGFAVQGHDRAYRPGPAWSGESPATFSAGQLHQLAQDALCTLQETVGETVQLMVLTGGNIQFVSGVESAHTLRVAVLVGNEMPAFVSSGGKAMLARFTNTELEGMYRAGLPAWPTGKTTTVATLKRHMSKIRKDGFGTSFEETTQGVVGLGMSINGADGRPVAAVTTATPSTRFSRSVIPLHVAALRHAADTIMESLSAAQR